MSRCLYNSSFKTFLNTDDSSIFGSLCDNYHGEALTTTREAWKSEITIMKNVLSDYADKNGEIIFEKITSEHTTDKDINSIKIPRIYNNESILLFSSNKHFGLFLL